MVQNVYYYLTPLTVILLLSEYSYCKIKKLPYFSFQDSFSSIGTALMNQMMNLLIASVVYWSYGHLWDYRFFTVEETTINFLLLILCIDFLFYWFHRFGHRVNVLWAAHMPHHSSEEMNLMVGLRASITQRLFSFMFYWPLVFVGFRPELIYMATGIHLFLGFLPHTLTIRRLGWLEAWVNTPSHHRVHHGINAKYIDKNYGGILIIWDKLFGTFQEEDENEEVIYGVYNHPKSWNPFDINFVYYKVLLRDFRRATSWWDRIRMWFMPLGWRPRNLKPYPKELPKKTKENFTKFTTPFNQRAVGYLIFKFFITIGVLLFVLNPHSSLYPLVKVLGAFWIVHTTVVWSFFMKDKSNSWAHEMINLIFLFMAMGLYFYSRTS
jgi:alkylglycerol monooxygenase